MRIQLSSRAVVVALALSCPLYAVIGAQAVDASIKPGDDFYAYANGPWLKAATIPSGKERWGARDEITEATRRRIAPLLDGAHAAAPGSAPRKVADYRSAWLDEATIEAKGLTPLKPVLDSIDAVHDVLALTRWLGRGMRADVDPLNWGVYRSSHLLGLSVEESINGEKDYVAFLVQGGLGLPDRENYLSTDARFLLLRAKYQELIGRTLMHAGFDRSSERAEAVMALETSIAQSHVTRQASANDRNADNVWTRADFAARAPGMDWSAFFAAAGLEEQQTFVAWQPTAVTGLATLVASQALETWKDYLRIHAALDLADVLPHALAESARALRVGESNASSPPSSRAQRALDATELAMGDAIGRMYVERYFPAEHKQRVLGVVKTSLQPLASASRLRRGCRPKRK